VCVRRPHRAGSRRDYETLVNAGLCRPRWPISSALHEVSSSSTSFTRAARQHRLFSFQYCEYAISTAARASSTEQTRAEMKKILAEIQTASSPRKFILSTGGCPHAQGHAPHRAGATSRDGKAQAARDEPGSGRTAWWTSQKLVRSKEWDAEEQSTRSFSPRALRRTPPRVRQLPPSHHRREAAVSFRGLRSPRSAGQRGYRIRLGVGRCGWSRFSWCSFSAIRRAWCAGADACAVAGGRPCRGLERSRDPTWIGALRSACS